MPTFKMNFARGELTCLILFGTAALLCWFSPALSGLAESVSGHDACDAEHYYAPHCQLRGMDGQRGLAVYGTSESTDPYNIGAQFGRDFSDALKVWMIARGGLSPINLSILMAADHKRTRRLRPAVLLVNPVYFTKAHDGLNWSWLTSVVESPAFILRNHQNRYSSISEPLMMRIKSQLPIAERVLSRERYFSQLLYLLAHPGKHIGMSDNAPLKPQRYHGSVAANVYSERHNVRVNWQPKDKVFKELRWIPVEPGDSLNAAALEYIARLYQKNKTKLLIVLLPWNGTFYESYGLDKDRWLPAFDRHRSGLKALADDSYISVIDHFDSGWMKNGFRDRMHMDSYGSFQVQQRLRTNPKFLSFLSSVFPEFPLEEWLGQ